METPAREVDALSTNIDKSCLEGFVITTIPHRFFSGVTKILRKKTFWTLHTNPQPRLPMLNIQQTIHANAILQRGEGRGEGKVK